MRTAKSLEKLIEQIQRVVPSVSVAIPNEPDGLNVYRTAVFEGTDDAIRWITNSLTTRKDNRLGSVMGNVHGATGTVKVSVTSTAKLADVTKDWLLDPWEGSQPEPEPSATEFEQQVASSTPVNIPVDGSTVTENTALVGEAGPEIEPKHAE